jgi:carbon storage regulator
MLVLTRRRNEQIVIDGHITVTVIKVQGDRVRLGIVAPRGVPIWREELREEIKAAAGLACARSDCSPPL